MECIYCGHNLVWQSDFALSDVSEAPEDDEGICSYYICPHCGKSYEIRDCMPDERANYPYWNSKKDEEEKQ